MKNKRLISLIIQGPLISIGVSGKTMGNDRGVVSYDCIDNINTIISNYGDMFHEIIISTWDDGVHVNYNPKGARVIRIHNPYEYIDKDGIHNDTKKNNALTCSSSKMAILGASSAINMLESVDYILRVRTDMHMDLSIIHDLVTSGTVTDKVYIPFVRIGQGIPDFYFFGKFHILKEFYDILIKDNIFLHTPVPHSSMILKYAKYKYYKDISVPDWSYYTKGSSLSYDIFLYMTTNAFISLPHNLYMGIRWRGELWNKNYIKNFKGCFSNFPCKIYPFDTSLKVNNSIEKLFFYPPKTILGKIIRRVSLVFIVGLVKFLNKIIH